MHSSAASGMIEYRLFSASIPPMALNSQMLENPPGEKEMY
jgi:hypothetical protein